MKLKTDKNGTIVLDSKFVIIGIAFIFLFWADSQGFIINAEDAKNIAREEASKIYVEKNKKLYTLLSENGELLEDLRLGQLKMQSNFKNYLYRLEGLEDEQQKRTSKFEDIQKRLRNLEVT